MKIVDASLIEGARLVILQCLAEDNDYSLNTSILQDCLAPLGYSLSHDAVETQCAWLAEQGLVDVEKVESSIVVTLTRRGLDVAQGLARQPGVKRPLPGG